MVRQDPEYAPVQERARKTRDRILAALETLLRERSFDDTSVADIADEAGVSVGAVYRRFRNKEAFLPLLFDLALERLEEAGREPRAWQGSGDLRTALRGAVAASWAFTREQAHLLRPVYLYGRLRPGLVGEEWTALREASRSNLRTLLERHRDELARNDLAQAAEMCSYVLNTSLVARGLYPESGAAAGMTLDDDTFTRSLADMIASWLTEAGEGTDHPPADARVDPGQSPAG